MIITSGQLQMPAVLEHNPESGIANKSVGRCPYLSKVRILHGSGVHGLPARLAGIEHILEIDKQAEMIEELLGRDTH